MNIGRLIRVVTAEPETEPVPEVMPLIEAPSSDRFDADVEIDDVRVTAVR